MNSIFITSGLDVYTNSIRGGTPESLLLYNDYQLLANMLVLKNVDFSVYFILPNKLNLFFLFYFEESCIIGKLI